MAYYYPEGVEYFMAPVYRPLCAAKNSAIQEYVPLYAWAVRTYQVPEFLAYFFSRWMARWPVPRRSNTSDEAWESLKAVEKARLLYELKNRAGYLIEKALREDERQISMKLVGYLINCLRNIHINEHTSVAAGTRCPSCTLVFDNYDVSERTTV